MSDSFIKVKIESILKSFNNKIPFLQPLYESISNSLEADATNIDVIFEYDDVFSEMTKPRIKGFSVVDNGIGFNKKNRESFCEYMSKHKVELGCKGIGRFTWLKVFQNIKIESLTETEKVTINFDKSFSEDEIKVVSQRNDKTETKITFMYVTDTYQNLKKRTDFRVYADLEQIKEDLEIHLMAKLFLLKEEKKKTFTINLHLGDKQVYISDKTILQLKKEDFDIMDDNKNSYSFNLYYSFLNDERNSKKLHYCADGRAVADFPKSITFDKLSDKASVTMLLTSSYFDDRINPERNQFTFDMHDLNPTLDAPLPFAKINDFLKKKIDAIVLERYPSITTDNKVLLDTCIEENPHLGKYIRNGEYGLIYNKGDLLKKANAEFMAEKEKVLSNFSRMLKENQINDETFIKNVSQLNDISNRELAQYFHYRQHIVDGLNDLNEKNECSEHLLHTLFMEKGMISDKSSEDYSPYNSNIWLLDDKYMSYTKMFSDKQVAAIKKAISDDNEKKYGTAKEPDLAICYNDVDGSLKDVVVIELKAVGASTTNKLVSLSEINRNLGFIAQYTQGLNSLYGYIITKLDSETQQEIELQNGVRKLFTVGNDPMYYFYNENIFDASGMKKPCHVYILSTDTIQKDAHARNKVFLDIVKNAN